MYLITCLFPFAGAGVNASPGTRHTQMPVTYSMQRAPLLGSSTGQSAQFLSSAAPVLQPIYNEQAVQMGLNYPRQVPTGRLAPYVLLPPPREQGNNVVLGETVFRQVTYSFLYQIGVNYNYLPPVPREQQIPRVPLPPLREAGMFKGVDKTLCYQVSV